MSKSFVFVGALLGLLFPTFSATSPALTAYGGLSPVLQTVGDLTPPLPLLDNAQMQAAEEVFDECWDTSYCSMQVWDWDWTKDNRILKLDWYYGPGIPAGEKFYFTFVSGHHESNWVVFRWECTSAGSEGTSCVLQKQYDTYYTCCWRIEASNPPDQGHVGYQVKYQDSSNEV